MDTKPYDLAYGAATDAAAPGFRYRRRKWAGQKAWNRENMVTESTQFTREQDARLRLCCHQAQTNRSQLISYMLQIWMAAWEAYRKEYGNSGNNGIDEPLDRN